MKINSKDFSFESMTKLLGEILDESLPEFPKQVELIIELLILYNDIDKGSGGYLLVQMFTKYQSFFL